MLNVLFACDFTPVANSAQEVCHSLSLLCMMATPSPSRSLSPSSPPRNPFRSSERTEAPVKELDDSDAPAMNATIDTEVQEFNIDGDLRALCEENVQAMKVLQSLGISSLIVFANFWDSPQEMREELTDMGILEPMISKISKVANATSESSARAVAVNLPSGSKPGPRTEEITQTIDVIQMSVNQSPSVESSKTSTRLEKALTGIWEILLSAQGHSRLLSEALELTTDLQIKMRTYLFKEWADMPHSSLQGYVRNNGIGKNERHFEILIS